MKRTAKRIWTVLILVCFLMTGCIASGTEELNKEPINNTSQNTANRVYRFTPSSRTTNQWEMAYGVISHDGRMILPVDSHEIYIIRDSATDEQLWIQTTTRTVDDPNLTAEEFHLFY